MTDIIKLRKIVFLWALSFPTIKKVWLFGSRAKNTHCPESDIDLAVEIDNAILIHEDARGHWMFEKSTMVESLQKHIEIKIHLLHYDPENLKVFPAFPIMESYYTIKRNCYEAGHTKKNVSLSVTQYFYAKPDRMAQVF